MTDVASATKAVIEDAATREQNNVRDFRVTVAPAVSDQVATALRRAYPKRMIMRKPIVGSSMFKANGD